ncbi:MAG: NAD(P)-dependent oxidoreductase, partial [Allosphingosinicella sp.]
MKIALIGATGNVGRRLAAEAVRRGHQVTAIARDPSKVEAADSVTATQGDLADPDAMADLLRGHDVAILSVRFQGLDLDKALGAFTASGVPRLMVVGGAASLEVAPGLALLDTPDFPDFIKPE